jgi:hypothetical protein
MPDVDHMQDELDPVAELQEQATNPEGLHINGANHGPTPMQSGERPDESFGGTLGGAMDLPSTQSSIGWEAPSSRIQALDNTDIPLSEVPVPDDSPVTHITFPVSITGDTATVHLHDLDGLGDFVNTRQTPNTWDLSLPTLFPPILNDGL